MPDPRPARRARARPLLAVAAAAVLALWLSPSAAREQGPWLRLGSARTGHLRPDEARWYSFPVAAGQGYRVEAGAPGLRLTLYDAHRAHILKSARGGLFVAAASSPGRRWVRLKNPSNARLPFRLAWDRYDPAHDDHASVADAATPLALGETCLGSVERVGDVDLFCVDLTGLRAYQFRFEALTPGERGLRLEVLDPSGRRVLDSIDVQQDPRRAFTWSSRPGRALLRVTDLDANPSASYALTWDLARDDFADHARGALRFPLGGALEGALESYEDEDWFALPLEQGQACRISYQGAFEAQLIASDGRRVLARGRYGALPTFRPTASGTYYLRIPPDRPGRYGLRVRID